MEAVYTSETSAHVDVTTRRCNPGDSKLSIIHVMCPRFESDFKLVCRNE
jgi:hypothetical protein